MTLDEILGRAYMSLHRRSEVLNNVRKDFLKECEDPEFKKAAQQRLDSLGGIDDNRCHMSAAFRRVLREWLHEKT